MLRRGRLCEVRHRQGKNSLDGVEADESSSGGELLRAAVRSKDVKAAEQTFAAFAQGSPEDAFNNLLFAVQDNTEVHRVVLPYRAWDLLGLIGKEQAHTLLRQSVRYCVKSETGSRNPIWDEPRTLLRDERGSDPAARAAPA